MTAAALSQATVVEAEIAVNRMDTSARLSLADEIFAQQPNLLASVLVLKSMGASLKQMDVPVHILLVSYQAMKTSGHRWPVISEDTQDICMRRLTGRARFTEGLGPALSEQAVAQQIHDHSERYLLAFAYGHLSENDMLSVKTEAQKYLLLATLNLVDCIAHTVIKGKATPPRQKATQ